MNQPKFNFPTSQINEATRNLTGYVLLSKDGRIWTDQPDERSVQSILKNVPDFETT